MPEISQPTDATVSKDQGYLLLPFFLLLLLPLIYAASLTWQEYLRLTVISFGLGIYARWHHRTVDGNGHTRSNTSMLLALSFAFVITQFDPATSAHSEILLTASFNAGFFMSTILVLCLCVAFWWGGNTLDKMYLIDWVIVGGLFISLGLVLGSHVLFEKAIPLNICIKFVLGSVLGSVLKFVL